MLSDNRDIPMKPAFTILQYKCNGEIIKFRHPECPRCRENGLYLWDVSVEVGHNYCHRCGQALDWNGYSFKIEEK